MLEHFSKPLLWRATVLGLVILLVVLWLSGSQREPSNLAVIAPSPTADLVVLGTVTAILHPTPRPPTPDATPAPPTSVPLALSPTPTTPAEEVLQAGLQLHRYGDTTAARSQIASLLAPEVDDNLRAEGYLQLTQTYLADSLYAEALAALDQLDALLTEDGRGVEQAAERRAKVDYLRAQALSGLGRYSEAIAAYDSFLVAHPQMQEIVQAKIAQAHLVLGNQDAAAAAYRRVADAMATGGASTSSRAGLLETLAQTYNNAGRYADAVAVYDEILTFAVNGGYRAEIQYLAGQSLAAAGDESGAIERWRAATEEAPASSSAYSALIELVNRQVDFDLYQRGYIDLEAEAWLPAINAFQDYLSSADPTDARVGLAWHGTGQAQLGAGNYAAAVTTLEHVVTEYASCDCAGQAWLDLARAKAALGDGPGARRTYRTFAREQAANPLAPEALWRSGLMAFQEGNQLEAAADFLALVDAFPTSDRAAVALYILGLGAYRTGLSGDAATLYTRLQSEFPDYRPDAVAYWLGRAHYAQGAVEQAHNQWHTLVEQMPDNYYGILAAQSLRQPALEDGLFLTEIEAVAGDATRLADDDGSRDYAERWLATWLGLEPDQLALLPSQVEQDDDLASGRLLLELDQRGDALPILERLYRRYQDDPHALYGLSLEFEQLGAFRLSLISMARLLDFSPAQLVEDAPIFLQQRAYPRHFAELIEREAETVGLEPMVLYSLIRQESLFEEGARSYAAAQGLAQIIPATGEWVADRLGYPGYSNDLIYRPYINVKFGAYYLDWARDYLDGNLVSALVGYNAGPGNSEYWRKVAGADDPMFVEILDVAEPRIYVQKIAGNLYHYTRLYGPS